MNKRAVNVPSSTKYNCSDWKKKNLEYYSRNKKKKNLRWQYAPTPPSSKNTKKNATMQLIENPPVQISASKNEALTASIIRVRDSIRRTVLAHNETTHEA